jgi:hypothetical protein
MTDNMNENQGGPEMGSGSSETFAWTEPEPTSGGAGQQAREWLTQLQAMIENLATQAAPVVREVGIKAAELAAKAGEKAGPVAQRAAELTGQAGTKLAERSRDLAAELRRDADAAKAASAAGAETVAETATEAAEAVEAAGEPLAETMTSDEETPSGVA